MVSRLQTFPRLQLQYVMVIRYFTSGGTPDTPHYIARTMPWRDPTSEASARTHSDAETQSLPEHLHITTLKCFLVKKILYIETKRAKLRYVHNAVDRSFIVSRVPASIDAICCSRYVRGFVAQQKRDHTCTLFWDSVSPKRYSRRLTVGLSIGF